MNQDILTLRSSIKTEFKQALLIKGSLIALLGFLPLLYAGTMVPAEQLRYIGLPIFLICFALIAYGLIPYRKICKLEIHPHEIHLSDTHLLYQEQGEDLLTLPLTRIHSARFISIGNRYGIGITLKESPEKIKFHTPLDMERILAKTQKEVDADLFFPFFSERSFYRLSAHLNDDSEENG